MTQDRGWGEAPPDVVPAHDGLYYASDEDLLRFAVPFLRDAQAREEATFVVGGPHTHELLVTELEQLERAVFIPSAQVFSRTATAVLVYQELVEEAMAKGASGVRALSEVDFGGTPEGLTETLRFEAVANFALDQQPLWNVCLYDVRRRPEHVIDESVRAHSHLVRGHERHPNPDYLLPTELLRRHSQATPYVLESRTPSMSTSDVRATGLANLRGKLHNIARTESTLSPDRVDEFVEAVNELATNALTHGVGMVDLRFWALDEQLVCTVTDQGGGFDNPLAGFLPVPIDTMPQNGAGLWLARNFSDSLNFTHTGKGFTARVSSWSHRNPGYAPS